MKGFISAKGFVRINNAPAEETPPNSQPRRQVSWRTRDPAREVGATDASRGASSSCLGNGLPAPPRPLLRSGMKSADQLLDEHDSWVDRASSRSQEWDDASGRWSAGDDESGRFSAGLYSESSFSLLAAGRERSDSSSANAPSASAMSSLLEAYLCRPLRLRLRMAIRALAEMMRVNLESVTIFLDGLVTYACLTQLHVVLSSAANPCLPDQAHTRTHVHTPLHARHAPTHTLHSTRCRYVLSREWHDLFSIYIFRLQPVPHCSANEGVRFGFFGLVSLTSLQVHALAHALALHALALHALALRTAGSWLLAPGSWPMALFARTSAASGRRPQTTK